MLVSQPAGLAGRNTRKLIEIARSPNSITFEFMNPAKVKRSHTVELTDLPNVGPSIANDLRSLGIHKPGDLAGREPVALYLRLNQQTGLRHDPCVLDVFMSVVDFMNGKPAKAWWKYTAARKKLLPPEPRNCAR